MAIWMPPPAMAVTITLGETADPAASGACASCTFFQQQTAATSPSYTVPPGDWTIVEWSIQGGPTTAGNARLRVFRPTTTMNRYQLVAESAEQPVPAGTLASAATSIPVQPGDLLGIRTGAVPGDIAGLDASGPPPEDVVWAVIGDPAVGQTVGGVGGDFSAGINPSSRVNVAATLHTPDPPAPPPDVNPPSDSVPPETAITKRPKDKTKKKTATFEFTSNEPGSTFECSLDDAAFAPCASPLTEKVKKGKHSFRVRAKDAAGNVDGSPATDDWKVKKKKKKKK